MQETGVRSLCLEDLLEKENVDCHPLQYSCLGNPMDRGAWRATVDRVSKSRTQLSTHSSLGAVTHLNPGRGSPGVRIRAVASRRGCTA